MLFRPKCVHINTSSAILATVLVILSNIQFSDTVLSSMDPDMRRDTARSGSQKEIDKCSEAHPPDTPCESLSIHCIHCAYNPDCIYGETIMTKCEAKNVSCTGSRTFERQMRCRYCYQTEPNVEHHCIQKTNCNVKTRLYKTNCTVNADVLCFGNRRFTKNIECNFTQGYRWSTALILSITLGGFGADRFYLGQWQEGIGKLFSFGGLGVWTLIDIILISLHYIGPADGSLYI